MLKTVMVSLTLTTSLCGGALAYDFTVADRFFAERNAGVNEEQRFSNASLARSEYAKAFSSAHARSLTQSEQTYAVVQMSRLDLYRGSMLETIDHDRRIAVLEACVDNVSKLEATKSQEYYYFYLACVASRGKLASGFSRLTWAFKMKNIQGIALESTQIEGEYVGGFEAGGIMRIVSAVRSNRGAKPLPLQLYNPVQGLLLADRALLSEARIYAPFPEPLSGADYFENTNYKAQAMAMLAVELADQDASYIKETREIFGEEGQQWISHPKQLVENSYTLLKDTLDAIQTLEQANSLPKGREPELAYYRQSMLFLYTSVGLCLQTPNWSDCLKKMGN